MDDLISRSSNKISSAKNRPFPPIKPFWDMHFKLTLRCFFPLKLCKTIHTSTDGLVVGLQLITRLLISINMFIFNASTPVIVFVWCIVPIVCAFLHLSAPFLWAQYLWDVVWYVKIYHEGILIVFGTNV